LPEIEAVFGEGVLSPEGCLDRPRLRERIFADPRARRQLEAILHPRILSDVRARLIAEHGIYVILVVPLLVETPEFLALVDRVLVVDCPEALQIERALSRPGMSRALLDAILAAQSTRAQRLAHADDVLDNGGGISALEEAVASLHAHYLAQAVAQGFTLPAQSLHFSMWRES
jgi:dephospho-CoA kinase